MDYALDDEESAVLDAARVLARSADPWAALQEGGWLDLILEDPDGGLPYLGLVAEELGAAGVAVSFPGTAALWPTLFGQSAGGRRVGVVFSADQAVEDGVAADLIVLRPDGYEDFEVEAVGGIEGDGLGRLVRLGQPIITSPDVETLGPAAMQRAIALACSEMAGLIRAVFELTLEHLRTREQFGVALATFQVIQHEASRLATTAEAAMWSARLAVRQPTPENVHAVKGWLSAAAHDVSVRAHQLHGAIGFTEEYGLQRLTKRLRTLRFAWGDDMHHHTALGRIRTGEGFSHLSGETVPSTL